MVTVNAPESTLCPCEFTTEIGYMPGRRLAGTVQVIEPSLHCLILAATVPNLTFPLTVPRFCPNTCTTDPRFPPEGVTPVTTGGIVTVNATELLLVQVSVTTVTAPEVAVSGTMHTMKLSLCFSSERRVGTDCGVKPVKKMDAQTD
jgi:hypothetical protein